MMHDLVAGVFAAAFANPYLDRKHDAAVLPPTKGRLAFTTDSYVVRPLFFPGGDIGSMAVHGTVNDLAMSGARPLYLSAGFVLEEGLPMETLRRVVASMAAAAERSGVRIVTGDTKVVDAGRGDGLFVNTSGIGTIEHDRAIEPVSIATGDAILVSGDVGRHGMAVMAVREGLEFESAIESDSASVVEPVLALLREGIGVRCMRDLTRGGLTTTLNEIAETSGRELRIAEDLVPVRPDVRAACEILGLDALQVACEGRFVAFVPESESERALALLRSFPVAEDARRIGMVGDVGRARIVSRGSLGRDRILPMPGGEQLPRIC